MQAQRGRNFYISYFATDRGWAAWIEWSLEEQGYSVITPAWGMSRGSSLELQIENALQIAEQVVVVLSPAYLSALAPQSKPAAAFRQGIVIPVRVQAVEVKGLPVSPVPINLFGVSESESRERLLKGIPGRRVGSANSLSSPKDISSRPTEPFLSPGQDISSRPTGPLLFPGQDISSRPTGPLLPSGGETFDTQLLSFMDTSDSTETVFHAQPEKPVFPGNTPPVMSETQILSASGAISGSHPGKTSLVASETGPLSTSASSSQAQRQYNDVYTPLKGNPHVTDPRTIEQRDQVVKSLYQELVDPGTTAIALVGMAGVGKSILASLLYRYAEDQCRGGKAPFPAGVLWLSINKEVTLFHLAGNLFTAVGEPFHNFSDPSAATQAGKLFEILNRAPKQVLAILDQFENLLDTKGNVLPDKPDIGEWLALLNGNGCGCKVLFTSRPLLQLNVPLTYLKKHLIGGLDESEGVELLRKLLEHRGVLGTSNADLLKAVQRCQGHSFALALLATAYINYRDGNQNPQSLGKFLDDPINARLWGDDIAEKLLNYIYTNQLSPEQQKLLLAFSVYREPVPVEAAAAVLEGPVNMGAIVDAFSVLLAQHLIQARDGNAYQLHAIVAEYARDRLQDQQGLQAAHARAARYYHRLPRKRGEIHSLVEATWHYCQAGQWEEAYYGLLGQQSIYPDLQRYGGNHILLELFLLLLPLNKWRVRDFLDGARIYRTIGDIYNALGQKWDARDAYEEALQRFRNMRDRPGEAETSELLGEVYSDLGEKQAAQRFFEEALSLFQQVGNREGEGETLNDLGLVFKAFHRTEEARTYLERALNIHRAISNRRGEGVALSNLGGVYNALGEKEQAFNYCNQALSIHREVGNRRGEGVALNDLGVISNDQGQMEEAKRYYKRALDILREVKDRWEEGRTLHNIGTFSLQQPNGNAAALASFLLAREAFGQVQSPDMAVTQTNIDHLRNSIDQQEYDRLLQAVQGHENQIVEQALSRGI